MIIGTVTVTRSMVHAAAALAAAVIALVLSVVGSALWFNRQIPMFGTVIAGLAARGQSVSLGGLILTQLATDFVFWFMLVFGVYLLVARFYADQIIKVHNPASLSACPSARSILLDHFCSPSVFDAALLASFTSGFHGLAFAGVLGFTAKGQT